MRKWIFFLIPIFFAPCITHGIEEQVVQVSSKDEVHDLDEQIDLLNEKKNLYLSKASQAQNQGDRLQFQNNNLLDAKRFWQMSDFYNKKAQWIDEKISILEKRKSELLSESGAHK